ncbi:4a-hydroxytetrahydrobiopterin dehydratase [Herminiimonas sp. CN]|uniref:4a-hydroxytetrahydrobiopterin dehydratase n=1 Tax=Herminiimonas sp. CN TaxID=1349818 RepID=UPI0004743B90|nr:4a-hydroxytetrahydrobiopterin dehydratase [Herminiimonas sp. CN]
MIDTNTLLQKKCAPNAAALGATEITEYLAAVSGWQQDGACIARAFKFKDYYDTLAFVNAIAYVIHAEDHHPELTVTYNRCLVKFDTHTANNNRGGISENDFICATKVNAIFEQTFS